MSENILNKSKEDPFARRKRPKKKALHLYRISIVLLMDWERSVKSMILFVTTLVN